ncbi:Hypothetical predicted protein [Paramuricea clavata]|uniref:Uncharacterized protein n=1 Tax=Paramuricea clavata TaxID=317549 RepID=A0A7D9LKD8_PARCT|nr:Hypothetical predicted protein [Paramuricea clavata]
MQGIDLLNVSLNKSTDEQKGVDKPTDEQASSTMSSSVQSGILNEALALSQAMEKLKIVSDEQFECAKERFKDARRRATDSFSNQALSIEDRLMAAKLHIVATILECLESPETAIIACLSFLKELHGLEAIVGIFSVYLNRGFIMSRLNKAQRVECVKSVMLVNYTLFQFVFKFSSSKSSSAYAWPTIELAERSFNPILHWQEVSTRKSMGDELTQFANRLILDEDITPGCSAVNSHGDVVVGRHADTIKIISKTGESKVVKLPELSAGKVISQHFASLAVDKNNKVYVVRWLQTRTENYMLDVLDDNYNVERDSRRLEYLKATKYYAVRIAITKNNNIVVIQDGNPQVYICDNTGKLKNKFERGSHYIRALGICGQNEIMIPSDNFQAVVIYSEKENLKSTVKLPEDHEVYGLAFNYVICKIIVLTYVEKKDSYFLLCYTEAGELETTTLFSKKIGYEYMPEIKSHPSGPVAIVREKSITFL